MQIAGFKAYDIRGKIPEDLNDEAINCIARAYATWLKPKNVIIGHDIRLSSPHISNIVSQSLIDSGIEVINIGLCGTEEVNFAVSHLRTGGGIMITASHNPQEYNGLKLIKKNSQSISEDTGLKNIQKIAQEQSFIKVNKRGTEKVLNLRNDYVKHLLSLIDVDMLKNLTIISNPGNGGAGLIINELEKHLPFKFIKIRHQPDGNFPNGVPNPLLMENRQINTDYVQRFRADMGIAWDGDFDRCFFFDETGQCIEGYYIAGLLADFFLNKHASSKIIHDSSIFWNIQDITKQNGGIAIQSRNGHSFFKHKMKQENAIFGAETSGHYYFRDFFHCDSGMIPWLLVAQIMSCENKKLSDLVKDRMNTFSISGEVNIKINHIDFAVNKIIEHFKDSNPKIDRVDGISLTFDDWRCNIRQSNTEPLIRLNIESKNNTALIVSKKQEILDIIKNL